MVNQRITIIGGLEGYNQTTQASCFYNITLLCPARDLDSNIYSPVLGSLGVYLSYQLDENVFGYFFAASKNENLIINPLVSPEIVAEYDMPRNLSIDFLMNNYVCISSTTRKVYKPDIYSQDLRITQQGRQWVNLGINDNGKAFDNVYYRAPGTLSWMRISDLSAEYVYSKDGELAICDSQPNDTWNANTNATRATAFYRHDGKLARGSVTQLANQFGLVGLLYVNRLSNAKNSYIRFHPDFIGPDGTKLQVLLDLNLS